MNKKRSKPFKQAKYSELCFLYGRHSVKAALLNPERLCHRLNVSEKIDQESDEIISIAQQKKLPIEIKLADFFMKNLQSDAVHQGLLLECDRTPSYSLNDFIGKLDISSNPTLLALDQITDPRNVGAIWRSAAAFGIQGILMSERNSPLENGAMSRAASGALDEVPRIIITNLSKSFDLLKEKGFWVYGLDMDGDFSIDQAPRNQPTLLVLGAEGTGIKRLVKEHCDQLTYIPMAETEVTSLNVAQAAAIALYVFTRP